MCRYLQMSTPSSRAPHRRQTTRVFILSILASRPRGIYGFMYLSRTLRIPHTSLLRDYFKAYKGCSVWSRDSAVPPRTPRAPIYPGSWIFISYKSIKKLCITCKCNTVSILQNTTRPTTLRHPIYRRPGARTYKPVLI